MCNLDSASQTQTNRKTQIYANVSIETKDKNIRRQLDQYIARWGEKDNVLIFAPNLFIFNFKLMFYLDWSRYFYKTSNPNSFFIFQRWF